MSKSTPSSGAAFFGAARNLNRIITSALDSVIKDLRNQGIFGVSTADLTALQLTLEAEGTTSNPIEIAEMGQMDKGAFNRCLKNLETNYVSLQRKGTTITSVTLTKAGRDLAEKYQAALNAKANELLGVPAIAQNVEKLVKRS